MHDDPSQGTPLLVVRPDAFTYEQYRLRVVDGPDAGTVCTTDEPELVLGTAQGNTMMLHDPAVSRHHCAIEVTARGYRLVDLGSTNGTFLGDYRIESAFLGERANIRVGISRLSFERLTETVREPLGPELELGRLIGQSLAMGRIFAALPRIAASGSTVLLEGETGTGKGLVAETIHELSPRAEAPLITVDCAALPETLIESELFGHARGAFTGASAARAGAFELAQGGTVFLDEIGELALDMQPKLLRVLENRVIRRVGGSRPIRLDVRVIAATNRDLRQSVNTGAFRADLYHRLNVLRLRLPPLRERREDIPMLVERFYRELDGPEPHAPQELVDALSRLDWPGNLRELRNAVERAVLFGEALAAEVEPSTAGSAEVSERFDPALSFGGAKARAVARWERWYLAELMRHAGGNLSAASRAARIDRTHLRALLRRHQITPE